jgi:hypothetical protein
MILGHNLLHAKLPCHLLQSRHATTTRKKLEKFLTFFCDGTLLTSLTAAIVIMGENREGDLLESDQQVQSAP